MNANRHVRYWHKVDIKEMQKFNNVMAKNQGRYSESTSSQPMRRFMNEVAFYSGRTGRYI